MSKEPKKLIPTSTVVKGLITGFVAYGVLITFIILITCIVISKVFSSLYAEPNPTITISLMIVLSIIIYFATQGICKLSTYDLFKNCKTEPTNYPEIKSKMNAFYLIFTIVIMIAMIVLLLLRLSNAEASINLTSNQYLQVFSKDFTKELTNQMITEFNNWKLHSIITTVCLELAFLVSTLSLIPLQPKLIKHYNTYRKPRAKKTDDADKKTNKK